MIFWMDEVVTNTNLVTYNDGLNYGRFDSPDLKIHEYKIEIDREEFIRKIQDEFWDCLCEIREDDKVTGDSSPFKRSGYKPLSQMFEHPHELAECIAIWFDRYILDKFIGLKDTFDYVINSTDEIKVADTKVLLSGKCFEKIYVLEA